MYKHLVLCCFLTLTGCQSSVNETEEKPPSSFSQLTALTDQYAEHALAKGNAHSFAIAMYSDGEVYHNYYGTIDPGQNNTPDDSTLFEMASFTKILTGSLAAKAVTEGKIAADDDIRMYLPGDYPNLEFAGTPVRIKDLVTHTLGFEMPEKFAATYQKIFAGYYEDHPFDYDMEDLLTDLKTVTLTSKPGEDYAYNNLGPELIAYILEVVYEQPYEQLLQAFFTELGMNNSYLQGFDQHEAYLANGYDEEGELATVVRNPLLGGAGGVIASLPDLTKFMQFYLEGKDPLIKEATTFILRDGEDGAGYFWDLGLGEAEGFFYQKTGDANGTQSVLVIAPEADYGLILITNNQSDGATYDWANLYSALERDLIQYPKINAWSVVMPALFSEPEQAAAQYHKLAQDTANYFTSSRQLNIAGYDYIGAGEIEKAIAVFQLAIGEDGENANLHDSLGEAYFLAEAYAKAKQSFEKSLVLDPGNDNAKAYLEKIAEKLEH